MSSKSLLAAGAYEARTQPKSLAVARLKKPARPKKLARLKKLAQPKNLARLKKLAQPKNLAQQ